VREGRRRQRSPPYIGVTLSHGPRRQDSAAVGPVATIPAAVRSVVAHGGRSPAPCPTTAEI
jgi:hypothetical protein